MRNPRTPARHLHIPPLHRLDVPHRVFVGQLAGDDVAEDFGFAVRVSGETGFGLRGQLGFIKWSALG